MSFDQLHFHHLRNLHHLSILPNPRLNFICGPNGSGKTSLLEGIYLLVTGRSFRQHIFNRIISFDQEKLMIQALFREKIEIALEKNLNGKSIPQLYQQPCRMSEIAQMIPTHLICPEEIEKFFYESKARRKFIDWILFHVEQEFYVLWQRLEKIVKQRNLALKNRLPLKQVTAWNNELIILSEKINQFRLKGLELFVPIWREIAAYFLPQYQSLQFTFYPGWEETFSFEEELTTSLQRDLALGYTSKGAHKATIQLSLQQFSATDIISRGEKKLLHFSFLLARGKLLQQLKNLDSVYLIDDISAELSSEKLELLLSELLKTNSQVFMTSVDKQISHPATIFELERGDLKYHLAS